MDAFKSIMRGLQEVAKIKDNKDVYNSIERNLNRWEEYKKEVNSTKQESLASGKASDTSIRELFNIDYLYHATYIPYLEEIIKSKYIKSGQHTNWDISSKDVVYLSRDPNDAFSYAETAEDVPEDYLDQVVVLKIDPKYLDIDKIDIDHNQAYWNYEEVNVEDPTTWIDFEYAGEIPIAAIVDVE